MIRTKARQKKKRQRTTKSLKQIEEERNAKSLYISVCCYHKHLKKIAADWTEEDLNSWAHPSDRKNL